MPPTAASPDTPATLLASHSLLRLLRHRNKNQHGKSKWWKWLCILERTVLKLVRAVEAENSNTNTLGANTTTTTAAAGAGNSEVERAFSTVVADNQFAVLGIVLLSILADLASVLRIRLDSVPEGSFPQASVLAEEEKKVATDKGALEATPVVSEDVGEVVYRGKDTPVSVEGSESTASAAIDWSCGNLEEEEEDERQNGR
ncbi:hypothetical protein PHISP_05932 [Aspergillus sp. HF37]|nr:hypothetical protein PHISP_05932 [Aspergillus sp. HF37]